MTNLRPTLLGYIRADALTTDRELAVATSHLADFAEQAGYELGTVYVERTDRVPPTFEALMAEAARVGASAVVMPGREPALVPLAWARQPGSIGEASTR